MKTFYNNVKSIITLSLSFLFSILLYLYGKSTSNIECIKEGLRQNKKDKKKKKMENFVCFSTFPLLDDGTVTVNKER